MNKLNLFLKKNNDYIISSKNIEYKEINGKKQFILDGINYTYYDKVLVKESNTDKLTFDFKKEICEILLKENNYKLNLKMDVKKIFTDPKKIDIIYSIETEEDVLNNIVIEYL